MGDTSHNVIFTAAVPTCPWSLAPQASTVPVFVKAKLCEVPETTIVTPVRMTWRNCCPALVYPKPAKHALMYLNISSYLCIYLYIYIYLKKSTWEIFLDPYPKNIYSICIPLYKYPVTSGPPFCKGPRSRACRMSWLQVYKMGAGGVLVWLHKKHRWTPKKKCLTKCLPQPHFPGPKPSHCFIFCHIKKLFGKMSNVYLSHFRGKHCNPFSHSPKQNLYFFWGQMRETHFFQPIHFVA